MFQFKRPAQFFQLPIFIGLLFVISSCEVEDYSPQHESVDFKLAQSIDLDETLQLNAESSSINCTYEWYINNETKLIGESVSYKFSEPGIYTVFLKTVQNGVTISSQQKKVEVLQSSTTFMLDKKEEVDYCFSVENKVIVHTKGNSSDGSFYVVNSRLQTDTVLFSLKAIEQYFGSVNLIGDSVLAYRHNQSEGQNFLRLKSTDVSELVPSSDLFNFIGGMVYTHKNSNGSLSIDYFDNSNNKLWSRDFNDQQSVSNVYTLNGYLFYLAFNEVSGTLSVEKFKNPSVIFKSETYSLAAANTQTELLFVKEDKYSEQLYIALYNYTSQYTRIYTIDKDCSLTLLTEYPGRVGMGHIELSTSGDFLSFENNELVKYNSEWTKLTTLSFDSSNAGFTQLADNLIFCYKVGVNNSLNMFFVDKHLQRVHLN